MINHDKTPKVPILSPPFSGSSLVICGYLWHRPSAKETVSEGMVSFFSKGATEGTIGTIGTQLAMYHSASNEGLATIITGKGRCVLVGLMSR